MRTLYELRYMISPHAGIDSTSLDVTVALYRCRRYLASTMDKWRGKKRVLQCCVVISSNGYLVLLEKVGMRRIHRDDGHGGHGHHYHRDHHHHSGGQRSNSPDHRHRSHHDRERSYSSSSSESDFPDEEELMRKAQMSETTEIACVKIATVIMRWRHRSSKSDCFHQWKEITGRQRLWDVSACATIDSDGQH